MCFVGSAKWSGDIQSGSSQLTDLGVWIDAPISGSDATKTQFLYQLVSRRRWKILHCFSPTQALSPSAQWHRISQSLEKLSRIFVMMLVARAFCCGSTCMAAVISICHRQMPMSVQGLQYSISFLCEHLGFVIMCPLGLGYLRYLSNFFQVSLSSSNVLTSL